MLFYHYSAFSSSSAFLLSAAIFAFNSSALSLILLIPLIIQNRVKAINRKLTIEVMKSEKGIEILAKIHIEAIKEILKEGL